MVRFVKNTFVLLENANGKTSSLAQNDGDLFGMFKNLFFLFDRFFDLKQFLLPLQNAFYVGKVTKVDILIIVKLLILIFLLFFFLFENQVGITEGTINNQVNSTIRLEDIEIIAVSIIELQSSDQRVLL